MKVFLVGGTGVLGRALLPHLVGSGDEVVALTRRPEAAPELEEAGATPVVGDAYDGDLLQRVLREHRPDVVVDQLTELPDSHEDMGSVGDSNNRVRREATTALVRLAAEAGVNRYVAEGISFITAPEGSPVLDEAARPWTDAPPPWDAAVRASLALEEAVTSPSAVEGIVLRFGYLYGPGTWYARDGSIARALRRREYPIVGSGGGIWSFVHVDDAAAATALALRRGEPGVYNVTDDEPAPVDEILTAFAAAVGAPPPERLEESAALETMGRVGVALATRARGADNAKAKQALGWQPVYASWRGGFARGLG